MRKGSLIVVVAALGVSVTLVDLLLVEVLRMEIEEGALWYLTNILAIVVLFGIPIWAYRFWNRSRPAVNSAEKG